MVFENLKRIKEYRKKGIKIGDHVFIGNNAWFDPVFPDLITIEDFVVMADNVKIITHDGSFCNTLGYYNQKAPVTIKRNSFIGMNSTILPGVTIGENAIVGASSVVTKNVPPNKIVAGNPAKIIGDIFSSLKKKQKKSRYIPFLWRSPYLAPEYINEKYFLIPLQKETVNLAKAYLNKEIKVNEGPKYLVIEPTNHCTLQCIMCPHKYMKRKKGFMDFNLFKKIIDEAIETVEFIYLHFFGEPFLHKDIFKFINYAGGKGVTVALSTNLTVLSEEDIENLLTSKLDLLILSCDGMSKAVYEKIRQGNYYDKVKTNLEYIINKITEKEYPTPNIVIQMIKMKYNKQEIETFCNHWQKYHPYINYCVKDLHDYANQCPEITTLKYGSSKIDLDYNLICAEPWRGFVVCWDGKVVPCCNDFDAKVVLGDTKKESLKKIWNGKAMQKFRGKHISKGRQDIPLCKNCHSFHINYLNCFELFSAFSPSLYELYYYCIQGLYPSEVYPEFENHWTKKEFYLFVQDRVGKTTFIFQNGNPIKEEINLKCFLYGKPLTTISFKKGEIKQVSFQTPKELLGRLLKFSFILSDTFNPKHDLGTSDNRDLGILLRGIINWE